MRLASSFGKPAFAPRDHLKPGRVARNEQERARQLAEIEARHTKPRKNANPQRRIALLRMYDLENLCRASDVPDDGGWEYLTTAAHQIAFIYRKADAKIAAIVAWGRRFTPSIPADRAKLLAERVIANPRLPSADKLGWRLRLTVEMRTALGITTIGAIGTTKAGGPPKSASGRPPPPVIAGRTKQRETAWPTVEGEAVAGTRDQQGHALPPRRKTQAGTGDAADRVPVPRGETVPVPQPAPPPLPRSGF
jgi:hypothetical protein